MINNHKIITDDFCEISGLLQSITDDTFYDFAKHDIVPGGIYIFSRQQFWENISYIKQLTEDNTIKVIFANPAEGADTIYWQLRSLGILELVRQRKILIVSGGYMSPDIPCMIYEHFLVQIHNYKENHQAIKQYAAGKQYTSNRFYNRPFKFLFLNGRTRTHRKYLLERFRANGLLDQSLWTNLDPRHCGSFRILEWYDHGDELLPQYTPNQDFHKTPFPIQSLPTEYEVSRYRAQSNLTPSESNEDMYVKRYLFNNEWGEIYLEPKPYLDTYFSLVTETTFDYQYSFRTEKIWKPIAIGHPWIAAGNAGYYRDMQNLGFKTFGHLIDESFDSIDVPLDRCARIAEVVEDLCKQDLDAFLTAADDVCKHNQERMTELHLQLPRELVERFINYVSENFSL